MAVKGIRHKSVQRETPKTAVPPVQRVKRAWDNSTRFNSCELAESYVFLCFILAYDIEPAKRQISHEKAAKNRLSFA